MKPMHYALALSATIAVAGLAFTANPAAAANSAMAECNKQWNDATAAKTNANTTYQDFLKSCLKKNSTAADTAKPAAATTTTTTNTATTTTKVAAADPATAKAKKDCAAQFKAAKDADPAFKEKKKDFVAACLAKTGTAPVDTTAKTTTAPAATTTAPAATTTKAVTPPVVTKPATTTTTTTTAKTDTSTDTTVKTDKNGKPLSPGQLAEEKRIKECGVEWKKAKADGTTNGLKWPQFWSACSKRLKAAGG